MRGPEMLNRLMLETVAAGSWVIPILIAVVCGFISLASP